MRVGIFSESYPPIVNGVSTSVRTLMAALENAGHTVFIFTSKATEHQHYVDDHAHVFRYPSVPSLVEPQYQLPIPFSSTIKATIPTLELDIIHSQSPFFLGMIARHVARTLHLPLVSTNHTIYTEYVHYARGLSPRVTRTLLVNWMRTYYNGCDYVLVPSDFTRRTLLAQGVHSPLMVLPTGIPSPPVTMPSAAEVKKRWGIPEDAPLMLYAGRLAPEKNLLLLLHAFSRIHKIFPKARLVLAGSGMGEPLTRQTARELGIQERTIFTGFLAHDELQPLYAAAQVFLFPSKTETQGLAVGEAMACGTPCVVVAAGGAPESVRDGVDGFLVDDDPEQMAEKALLLLQSPALRERMSDEARSQATARTPESRASQMIALYEELLGNAKRKGLPSDTRIHSAI